VDNWSALSVFASNRDIFCICPPFSLLLAVKLKKGINGNTVVQCCMPCNLDEGTNVLFSIRMWAGFVRELTVSN